MIERLDFAFGSSSGQSPLSLKPGHLTVFVGPNNGGRSLVLREIALHLGAYDHQSFKGQAVNAVYLRPWAAVEAEKFVRSLGEIRRLDSGQDEVSSTRVGTLGRVSGSRATMILSTTVEGLVKGGRMPFNNLRAVMQETLLVLDGASRLGILSEVARGDLQLPPETILGALFRDDKLRARLGESVREALGGNLVIDPTGPGTLRARLSERPAVDSSEERAFDDRAIAFHGAARPISEESDGVKAFAGTLAALLASEARIIIVDEPEAFLHPPLARRLGRELASTASARNGNLFAATHSADFLAGVIETGRAAQIVRLTYDRNVGSARLLDEATLKTLTRDPFLRSTGVLQALFNRAAVIVEGASDRAFYQEVNERLREARKPYIGDALFFDVGGDGRTPKSLPVLRAMGVAAIAIVDIDVLWSSGFTELMLACGIPRISAQGHAQTGSQLRATFEKLGAAQASVVKPNVAAQRGGVEALPAAEKQAAKDLIASLAKYGLFVVDVGNVERWLRQLGVPPGNKTEWLGRIFDAMGADPNAPSYVPGGADDVWAFIGKAAAWCADPERLGMPP